MANPSPGVRGQRNLDEVLAEDAEDVLGGHGLHVTEHALVVSAHTVQPLEDYGCVCKREIRISLQNNQCQHRTSHALKDVLPLRICANCGASCQPLCEHDRVPRRPTEPRTAKKTIQKFLETCCGNLLEFEHASSFPQQSSRNLFVVFVSPSPQAIIIGLRVEGCLCKPHQGRQGR